MSTEALAGLIIVFFAILILFGIAMFLRRVTLWYFCIDEIVSLLKKIETYTSSKSA